MIKNKVFLAIAALLLPMPTIASWLVHSHFEQTSDDGLQRQCRYQAVDSERRLFQRREGIFKQLIAGSSSEERRLLQLESPQSTLYSVEEEGLCDWIEEFDRVKVTEFSLETDEKKNLLVASKLFHHYNTGLLRAEELRFTFNVNDKEKPRIEGNAERGRFTVDKGLANGVLEKPSIIYRNDQL